MQGPAKKALLFHRAVSAVSSVLAAVSGLVLEIAAVVLVLCTSVRFLFVVARGWSEFSSFGCPAKEACGSGREIVSASRLFVAVRSLVVQNTTGMSVHLKVFVCNSAEDCCTGPGIG